MNVPSLILVAALIPSQDTGASAQPPRRETKAPSSEHRHKVETSGDQVMGFSHEKTTHHFLLRADGGVIQVDANSPDDKESRDQIQGHLGHIAKMFAAGDFKAPMLVHSATPPGTATMTRLKTDIRYTYETSPLGAQIVIATANKEALAAIHEFLKFQIKDHNTGDSTTVSAK